MEKWLVEKKFEIPAGHRLSKHLERCHNYHGHNFKLFVGVSSVKLNKNDMVIDFKDLKNIINEIIDEWDHTLLINKDDPIYNNSELRNEFRIIAFDFDPTAEMMTKTLFNVIKKRLVNPNRELDLKLEYIKIFENDNSMCVYSCE